MAHYFHSVSLEEEMIDQYTAIPTSEIAMRAKEIERLVKIEQAARNLIAQKGRHNTEIAYKKLEEVLK